MKGRNLSRKGRQRGSAFAFGVLVGIGVLSTVMQFVHMHYMTMDIGMDAILRPQTNPLRYDCQRNSLQTDQQDVPMIVAGLIRDGASIKNEILTTLVQLSCMYGAPVLVTVAENAPVLKSSFHLLRHDLYRPDATNLRCQSLTVQTQPPLPNTSLSRAQKLAFLRDVQRQQLSDIIVKRTVGTEDPVILLMDLDLLEVPPVFQIMETARIIFWGGKGMDQNATVVSADAVCAGGVTVDDQDGWEGYYDSFATIFEPDTYMVPLSSRAISSLRPDENKDLIIADNSVNFYSIWEWMKRQDSIPVQSCFGGMALYRATKFLDKRCSYSTPAPGFNISVYEVENEGVCEHIVLNTCLHRIGGLRLAILPALRTRWTPNDGLQVPRDFNIAATKFKTSGDNFVRTTETIVKREHETGGMFIGEKHDVESEVLSLAQLKEIPKIRKGNKFVVCKPGPHFGMEATVVLNIGDMIHVRVGNDVLPLTLRDLTRLKPGR